MMQIDCGPCTLRPWHERDIPSLAKHADDRDVWLNLRDRFPHPYTRADAESWIGIASSAEPVTNFAIDVSGEAVGGIGVELQHDVDRVAAEIGYWLGREFWGRGIMTAALRAATDYAFATFDLTRIYAVPYTRNTASRRVLQKAGYVVEGILRRSAVKDGKIVDQVMCAVTDVDRAASPAANSRRSPTA